MINKNILQKKDTSTPCQCDQFGQNFTSLAKLKTFFGNFEVFI